MKGSTLFWTAWWCALALATPASAKSNVCPYAPQNGDIVNSAILPDEDLNELEIHNASKANAIVKLREEADGATLVAFFIARGRIAILKHIPDGRFWLQFAFGSALDPSCGRFAKVAEAGEFPVIQTFESDFTGASITHTRLAYTLYAVPMGTIVPRPISGETFDSR